MTTAIALMIGLIVLSLIASFMLSLSEASLLAVSPHEMQKAARAGDRRAHTVLAVTERGDFLYVFIICNNALILVMSTLMTLIVRYYVIEDEALAASTETIAHIGMVVVILVFGELLPKTYGSLRPGPSARAIAGIMKALIAVLRPMVNVLTWVTDRVVGSAGASYGEARYYVTAEEILAAADLGEEDGTVEPDEGEMLDSVMELAERVVKDIMVPRVDMVALSEEATLEEFVEVALDSGFSRIPVFADSIDRVTGVVYVNDVLAKLTRGEQDTRLNEVAREPILAPETKRLDEMLWELRDQKVHIAIVIDEFGATEGLVTIEDILEELVGEIEDEHDLAEPDILIPEEGEALVTGKARIDELNQQLGIELATDSHDTISGFLTGMAGRVPQEGEVLTSAGVTFVVIASNHQHIERLRVIAPKEREAEQ